MIHTSEASVSLTTFVRHKKKTSTKHNNNIFRNNLILFSFSPHSSVSFCHVQIRSMVQWVFLKQTRAAGIYLQIWVRRPASCLSSSSLSFVDVLWKSGRSHPQIYRWADCGGISASYSLTFIHQVSTHKVGPGSSAPFVYHWPCECAAALLPSAVAVVTKVVANLV